MSCEGKRWWRTGGDASRCGGQGSLDPKPPCWLGPALAVATVVVMVAFALYCGGGRR